MSENKQQNSVETYLSEHKYQLANHLRRFASEELINRGLRGLTGQSELSQAGEIDKLETRIGNSMILMKNIGITVQ